MLLIERRDGRSWTWIALAEVPDISLLEALLERVCAETFQENSADDEYKNQKNQPPLG